MATQLSSLEGRDYYEVSAYICILILFILILLLIYMYIYIYIYIPRYYKFHVMQLKNR